MDVHDFVGRYPRLYHLAHGDAWPGLQAHGLLSAAALTALMETPDPENLLSRRRPDPIRLAHPLHGAAVLRDQRALNVAKLERALTDGMTVEQWLRLLNSMVFFFPTVRALETLLAVYGSEPVVILTVNTRSLVQEHGASMKLAHINTGNTAYAAASRGPNTFVGIRRFDHTKRIVKEVTVGHKVHDILDHLIVAQLRRPDGTVEDLPR